MPIKQLPQLYPMIFYSVNSAPAVFHQFIFIVKSAKPKVIRCVGGGSEYRKFDSSALERIKCKENGNRNKCKNKA